jgi:hypothetical protein
MKFHDRRWIRGLRRRIRTEVRKSERLRELRDPVFTRNRSVSPMFARIFLMLAWVVAGWFLAEKGTALRALPYWAWFIFLSRWNVLGQFANFATLVRHLPIRREESFVHLWKEEVRAFAILAVEFAAVLGAWLQAHGFCGWGWLIAAPIAALSAAAMFAFASAVFSFIGMRWIWIPNFATVCVILALAFGFQISYEFVTGTAALLNATLIWITPGGWAVEAVRSLPSEPWTSALFIGATLSAACTLPILRRRLWDAFRDLVLIDPPWRFDEYDEEEEFEPAPPPPSPGETLSPEEEEFVKGEVVAAFQVFTPDRKPSVFPAGLTFPFVPGATRWTLLYQLLGGEIPRWRASFISALKYSAGGLALLFVVRGVAPGLGGVVFGFWGAGFALGYLPLFGGYWPGLTSSGSASRMIPYISLVPVGTWELTWIMLVSNYTRLAVFGAVAVPAAIAAAAIIGLDPVQSAFKVNITFATLALLQPVAIACQFMHASRMRGCVNLLVALPFVLFGLVLCLSVILFFTDWPHGLRTLLPVAAVSLGILYVLSAILLWRYSRRKMDVIT